MVDHLGNVTVQLSDEKTGLLANGSGIGGITAKTLSYRQYFPFGWAMPGRSVNPERMRFTFNGKELDAKEWGMQDFGARIYDSRVPVFLSLDPKAKEYPELSPYVFAGNSPIQNIDENGENPIRAIIAAYRYAKKSYKAFTQLKKGEKFGDKLKDIGMEEFIDLADNLTTLFSGSSSGWEKASAAVDIFLGVDMKTGKKVMDQKAMDKVMDEKGDVGVYSNVHKEKGYIGSGSEGRQLESQKTKEQVYGDPADKNNSEFHKSKDTDNAREEEGMVIEKTGAAKKDSNYYNKNHTGRTRVDRTFGGDGKTYRKSLTKSTTKPSRRY